jgi:diphosphomevalonate decarboxylase
MNEFRNSIYRQSQSNIAIIKYWGKHGDQLPNNASLSLTLTNAFTTVEMHYKPAAQMDVEYYFEGVRNAAFEEKVETFLTKVNPYFRFLDGYSLRFESRNSFPHSTGIASSASSMSALAKCLVAMESEATGISFSEIEMVKKTSFIARLGSGSASRSVYDGWVSWGRSDLIPGSSNEYATPLPFKVDPLFDHLCDAVLIVSSQRKKVSSTVGHRLMDSHPFAESRYIQAELNLAKLIKALQGGDFDTFAVVAENEALTLHSLLMTSSPDGLLLMPSTLTIIGAIRDYRKETGTKLCFTLDAGPNVHLLYPECEREKVVPFIEQVLLPFCENRRWIDDRILYLT